MAQPDTYRGWTIHYDPPPVPWRGADWQATAPGFDADCVDGEFFAAPGTSCAAGSLEDLKAEIDAIIEEAQDGGN